MMVTGTLYIECVEDVWETAAAVLIDETEGKARVMFFPQCPEGHEDTPALSHYVTATVAEDPPEDGQLIYVAD
jgi:hypothetical protein